MTNGPRHFALSVGLRILSYPACYLGEIKSEANGNILARIVAAHELVFFSRWAPAWDMNVPLRKDGSACFDRLRVIEEKRKAKPN